jgi:hypothetical protein
MTMPTMRISRRQLEALPEYSTSLPTGTYIGKLWRRNVAVVRAPAIWRIGGYFPHEQPDDFVYVRWFKPFLTIADNPDVERSRELYERNVQTSFGR